MTDLGLQSPPTSNTEEKLHTFARWFDHTNLKPTAQSGDIAKLCEEAASYTFGAVCIAPRWVRVAANALSERGAETVQVCTVIGFPNGNATTDVKALETADAINNGASEIDMVISIGDLKGADHDYVCHDIAAVVEAAKSRDAIVKVILETAYLEADEIVAGCELAASAGADFVKTSTGFGPAGADPKVVRLMRQTVGDDLGVKAAGGISTLQDSRTMLDAGATRLGCSSSVAIIEELRSKIGA